ncbi:MAG: hypothetical protein JWP37_1180 [Mucilaginibacter sp.]|nr:hypothetical protein [Mucilaginibacter sp.]
MENISNVVIAQKRLIELRTNHYTFFKNFEHIIRDNDAILYFADLTFNPYATLTLKKGLPISLLQDIIKDLRNYFEVIGYSLPKPYVVTNFLN